MKNMTDRQRWYIGLAKRKPITKNQEIICCPRCKGEGTVVRNARRENYKRWYEENKQRLKEARLRKRLVGIK